MSSRDVVIIVMMKAERLFWVLQSPGPSEELKPHKKFYMRGREREREEDRELETRVEEVISGSFCVMHYITRTLHTLNYQIKIIYFKVVITKCFIHLISFTSLKDLTLLTPTFYEFRVSIKINEHILHIG